MLTKRYLVSTKNVGSIFQQIISGTAPDKFTVEHLKNIGFGSSSDRAIIPLLKDLGFLNAEGTPTERYHSYRNKAQSKAIMGEALKEAYQPVFHINEKPSKSDREAIMGLFKSTHNVTDKVAEMMAMTFFCLLDMADISATAHTSKPSNITPLVENHEKEMINNKSTPNLPLSPNLKYNIEIQLPATKDIEVYNAIFKSLKQHLIDA